MSTLCSLKFRVKAYTEELFFNLQSMRSKHVMLQLRRKVQWCSRQKKLKTSEIAKKLGVSRDFVIEWKNKRTIQDHCGWPKGKKKKIYY